MTAGPDVVVSHHYAASAERVFDAFLNVEIARRFLFATATGEMIAAEVDPRVGGRFTFTDRRPDMGDVSHVGEYLEIARPHRLAFTFGVPKFSDQVSVVTIDIRPDGEGCHLTLTNAGVPPAYRESSQDGWTRILLALLPAYEGVQAAG